MNTRNKYNWTVAYMGEYYTTQRGPAAEVSRQGIGLRSDRLYYKVAYRALNEDAQSFSKVVTICKQNIPHDTFGLAEYPREPITFAPSETPAYEAGWVRGERLWLLTMLGDDEVVSFLEGIDFPYYPQTEKHVRYRCKFCHLTIDHAPKSQYYFDEHGRTVFWKCMTSPGECIWQRIYPPALGGLI